MYSMLAFNSPDVAQRLLHCRRCNHFLPNGTLLLSWFTQELQRDDEGQSGAAAGSLSALFRRVVNVCQSQFIVIGQVFPPPLVAKVTRLLLQRILNDPVYGVQVRGGVFFRALPW